MKLYRVNLNIDLLADDAEEAKYLAVHGVACNAETWSVGQATVEVSPDDDDYWRLLEQNDPDYKLRNR